MRISIRKVNDQEIDIVMEKTAQDGTDFKRINLKEFKQAIQQVSDIIESQHHAQERAEKAKFEDIKPETPIPETINPSAAEHEKEIANQATQH